MAGENNLVPDEQLAAAVQKGDTERFGELVERYQEKMLRYGRRFLPNNNNLEDLVQEVFIKAYENIQSFDANRKFSAWLYRIAHNQFINEWRKNNRNFLSFIEPDLLALNPAKDDVSGEQEAKEIRVLLEKSLQGLDQKYREVLILYYLEDFSYKEIADILKIPIATVGVRLQRGKEKLKNIFNEADQHGPTA